jgi:exodeoxyribonuclease VII large subunit
MTRGGGFFDFLERQQRAAAQGRDEAASVAASKRAEPLSVTQLTSMVERAIRGGLPESLHVRGEISNFSHHRSSGHFYFTLKDAGACVDCVMFQSSASKLKFRAADGLEVIASGQVRVYAARGRYQLYVASLHPVGQGALELAFRQLCDQLRGEGLFNADRKKPIPLFPRRIALVTARTGAAVQDMLKVLRHYPLLELMLVSVAVQGETAAKQIAEALRSLNRDAGRLGGIDVILLGRGGGSMEDLWAFNEEPVARAIAASRIPIVTGVGHEVDTTIADFVADARAHTPTEAATFVTQHWKTAGADLAAAAGRMRRAIVQQTALARQRLLAVERHPLFRRPTERIDTLRQMLDDRERSLALRLAGHVRRAEARLRRLGDRLAAVHPRHALSLQRVRLDALHARLGRTMAADVARFTQRVETLGQKLELLSPTAVLQRGYSITTIKSSGRILRSPGELRGGERLVTRLGEGEVESVADDPKQPKLFE